METSLRDLVWQRAQSRCEYCRITQDVDPLPFQVDHIIARQHDGPTVADNLGLACFACNHHKGPNLSSIDWESGAGEIVRLFHPRSDHWEDHFEWHGPRLHGKTSVGRATILCLAINLPHRIALRDNLANE